MRTYTRAHTHNLAAPAAHARRCGVVGWLAQVSSLAGLMEELNSGLALMKDQVG